MKIWGKKIKSLKDSNDVVSEIVGTILLLSIVVVVFSTLYSTTLSYPFSPAPPNTSLVGTVDGSTIVIEHRGGDSLSLDTKISITINNSKDDILARDLSVDFNGDGLWNIGESLIYPFEYDINHTVAEIMAVDGKSNSIVMMGSLNINPECDIGIECSVSNPFPTVGTNVEFSIIVTHYRGDIDVPDIEIEILLPSNGLEYQSNVTTPGTTYDHITGIWEIGNLAVGESATLTIIMNVTATGETTPTQLAMILDGSGSISPSNWNLMTTGLADAIKKHIPHDDSVELTIIQFAGYSATLEIEPEPINQTNFETIATSIENIVQRDGYTPMGAGINLAADILSGDPYEHLIGTPWEGKASDNFNPMIRQVINIVTDGKPNVNFSTSDPYTGVYVGYDRGKSSAVYARDYLTNTLQMTQAQDEIDIEAVGTGPEIPWLRDNISWPQPGYDTWPPPGPGWVREVDTWQNFSEALDETFELLFNSITFSVEILPSILIDPNIENNEFYVTIIPQE